MFVREVLLPLWWRVVSAVTGTVTVRRYGFLVKDPWTDSWNRLPRKSFAVYRTHGDAIRAAGLSRFAERSGMMRVFVFPVALARAVVFGARLRGLNDEVTRYASERVWLDLGDIAEKLNGGDPHVDFMGSIEA